MPMTDKGWHPAGEFKQDNVTPGEAITANLDAQCPFVFSSPIPCNLTKGSIW